MMELGIEKPRPAQCWAEAHFGTQFPKEEKASDLDNTISRVHRRERERERNGLLLLLLVTDHGSGHWFFPGAS